MQGDQSDLHTVAALDKSDVPDLPGVVMWAQIYAVLLIDTHSEVRLYIAVCYF